MGFGGALTAAAGAATAASMAPVRGGAAATLLLALFLLAPASAAPHRQKRVSDQRLAELETRVALNRLKGIVVTVPVGFGKVDPDKLGRRRRSEADPLLLQQQQQQLLGAQGEGDGADEGEGDGAGAGGRLAELLAALNAQRLRLPALQPPRWLRPPLSYEK